MPDQTKPLSDHELKRITENPYTAFDRVHIQLATELLELRARNTRLGELLRTIWKRRRQWQTNYVDLISARARIAELETEARNMGERLKSATRVVDSAAAFINQRPEYVDGCRNGGADDDYYRWQGGAEARRQLAQRLGWTVPHEHGEKTTPQEVAGRG
ncbi:hypothetical protein [Nocardia abscessus]|uniref:hypothetical protein n=1 Tax=Nocardia abscessus TaxID=120957 RepID=UPI002454EE89|nr:hypothetical protein [Nocardia abscessus]